jgi:di/tripeptidase
MNHDVIDIIENVARVPSFSSYEERIHPLIYDFIKENKIACEVYPHHNNLIIEINKNVQPTIALTAHLDKIDHFNSEMVELPFERDEQQIKGQLDDSVGVGMCLYLLLHAARLNFPNTLFLFSEMEESFGLRNHPGRLKNQGKGLHPQIGAFRISEFLMAESKIPSLIITLDTTPLFHGNAGVSLYSRFWEISGITPPAAIIQKTMEIEKTIQDIYPEIKQANNNNDYVKYGHMFAAKNLPVPSIALEPAIYPYHTIGERMFISDIQKVLTILRKFIAVYARQRDQD